MTLHRIRLREPWQWESPEAAALWRRRFGRPTGLGPDTTVWLVVENASAPLVVQWNGDLLGPVSGVARAARFDVTARLLARNEVTIMLEQALRPSEGISPGLPADVCLEIVSGKGDN